MILAVHVTRQLWIQLRLLGLVSLPIVAAIVAVTVAGQTDSPAAGRLVLATGSALVAVISAVLVGTGFTEEIRSGAAAWLVVRAVPRTSLIGAWLVVPALVSMAAYLLGGILASLAIPPAAGTPSDPLTNSVSVFASAAPVIPLFAIALAIGVGSPARVTAIATIAVAVLAAVPLVLLGNEAVHPATGYWLVAGLGPTDRPITVGLQAIGLCLAVAAIAWVWAARRFLRRDL